MRALRLGLAVNSLPSHAEYPIAPETDHIDRPVRRGRVERHPGACDRAEARRCWKIPVVIENYVGASGSLGAARAAQAAPDGYTLLILSSTYTINSAIMPKLPFDARTSFAPVTMLGKGAMMLATRKGMPVGNIKD